MPNWPSVNAKQLVFGKYNGDQDRNSHFSKHLSGFPITKSFIQGIGPCYYSRTNNAAIRFANGTNLPGFDFCLPSELQIGDDGWAKINVKENSPLLQLGDVPSRIDDRAIIAWVKVEGKSAYDKLVSSLKNLKEVVQVDGFSDELLTFVSQRVVGEISNHLAVNPGQTANAIGSDDSVQLMEMHSDSILRYLLNPTVEDLALGADINQGGLALSACLRDVRKRLASGKDAGAPRYVNDYYTYFEEVRSILLDRIRMACIVLWYQIASSENRDLAVLDDLTGALVDCVSSRSVKRLDYEKVLGAEYETLITVKSNLKGQGELIAGGFALQATRDTDKNLSPKTELSRTSFQQQFLSSRVVAMITKLSDAGKAIEAAISSVTSGLGGNEMRNAERQWAEGKAITSQDFGTIIGNLGLDVTVPYPTEFIEQIKSILGAASRKLGDQIDKKVQEDIGKFQMLAKTVELVYSGLLSHNSGTPGMQGILTAHSIGKSKLASAHRDTIVGLTVSAAKEDQLQEWDKLCQTVNDAAVRIGKNAPCSISVGGVSVPLQRNASSTKTLKVDLCRNGEFRTDFGEDKKKIESLANNLLSESTEEVLGAIRKAWEELYQIVASSNLRVVFKSAIKDKPTVPITEICQISSLVKIIDEEVQFDLYSGDELLQEDDEDAMQKQIKGKVEALIHEVRSDELKRIAETWNALRGQANIEGQGELKIRITLPESAPIEVDGDCNFDRLATACLSMRSQDEKSLDLSGPDAFELFSGKESINRQLTQEERDECQKSISILRSCSVLSDNDAASEAVETFMQLHVQVLRGEHMKADEGQGERESLALLLAEVVNTLSDTDVGFNGGMLAHEFALVTMMVEQSGTNSNTPKPIVLSECFPIRGTSDVRKIIEYYYLRCEQAIELVSYAKRIKELEEVSLLPGIELAVLDCTLAEYIAEIAGSPSESFFGIDSVSPAMSVFVSSDAGSGAVSLDTFAQQNIGSAAYSSLLFLDNGEKASANFNFFCPITSQAIPQPNDVGNWNPLADVNCNPLLLLSITSLKPIVSIGGSLKKKLSIRYNTWTSREVFPLFFNGNFRWGDRDSSTWVDVFRKFWCYDKHLANTFIQSRIRTMAYTHASSGLGSFVRTQGGNWQLLAFEPLSELHSKLTTGSGRNPAAEILCQVDAGDMLTLPLANLPATPNGFGSVSWFIRESGSDAIQIL